MSQDFTFIVNVATLYILSPLAFGNLYVAGVARCIILASVCM